MQLNALNVIVQISGVRHDLGCFHFDQIYIKHEKWQRSLLKNNSQFDFRMLRLNFCIFIRFKLSGQVLICMIEWKSTRYIYGDRRKMNRWKNIFNGQSVLRCTKRSDALKTFKTFNINFFMQWKNALIAVYRHF